MIPKALTVHRLGYRVDMKMLVCDRVTWYLFKVQISKSILLKEASITVPQERVLRTRMIRCFLSSAALSRRKCSLPQQKLHSKYKFEEYYITGVTMCKNG